MDPATFDSETIAVAPQARAALAVSLRRLRHDLGKSMSLQLRFAGELADDVSLAEALREDVLYTRRGPSGTMSAFELFDSALPWLTGSQDLPGAPGRRVDLSNDAVFQALVETMRMLSGQRSGIERGDLRGALLRRLVAHVHDGTRCCRELVTRYPEVSGG